MNPLGLGLVIHGPLKIMTSVFMWINDSIQPIQPFMLLRGRTFLDPPSNMPTFYTQ